MCLPSLLRLISSGETGRNFLSALISSSILSCRLRGRGGVGFSFLAEALGYKDNNIYIKQCFLENRFHAFWEKNVKCCDMISHAPNCKTHINCKEDFIFPQLIMISQRDKGLLLIAIINW